MEIIRQKTIAIAGNRVLKSRQGLLGYELESSLSTKLIRRFKHEHLKNGVNNFVVGYELGFDRIAATAVASLKNKYPKIKLILIAFRDEEISIKEQVNLLHLLRKCDCYFSVAGARSVQSSVIERNKLLVGLCARIIVNNDDEDSQEMENLISLALDAKVACQDLCPII